MAKRNEVPLNEDEAWSLSVVFITVTSVFVGIVVFFCFSSLMEKNFWISLFLSALIIFTILPALTTLIFMGAMQQTLCPACKALRCIEYLDEETITETISSERVGEKIKRYRIGIERIRWKCKNCRHEDVGEREYKREV